MLRLLAENFQGLNQIFFGLFGMLALMALISLLPAWRGHWSALLLAIPCVLLGGLTIMPMLSNAPAIAGIAWLTVLTPTILGIISMGLWSEAQRRRRER